MNYFVSVRYNNSYCIAAVPDKEVLHTESKKPVEVYSFIPEEQSSVGSASPEPVVTP